MSFLILQTGGLSMRKHRTPDEWSKLIQEQINSGLSASAFCKNRSIHPNVYYQKRKQLGSCQEEHNNDFVELTIPCATDNDNDGDVEIKIGNICIYPGNSVSKESLIILFSAALEAHSASLQ